MSQKLGRFYEECERTKNSTPALNPNNWLPTLFSITPVNKCTPKLSNKYSYLLVHEYGKKPGEHIRNILNDNLRAYENSANENHGISNGWQKKVQKIVLGKSVVHLEGEKITKP